MGEKAGAQAFEGVNVLDFSRAVAGPMTTKYLADHGATVIRIESASATDITRVSAPYKDHVSGLNRSGYYNFWNANKYSLGLNLAKSKGVALAKRLVPWADVVVENFSPGVMERLGLDYETLRSIKPDIIMYRSSNQGETGPHAQVAGYGAHLSSLVGFSSLTGWPDRAPAQPFGGYTDVISPPLGAAALIAALDYRRKTGKGQMLDVSQWEAALQFLAPSVLDYVVNGRETERTGNRSPHAAPHGVYRCKGQDRWCAISVFTDEEWEQFCRVIGDPGLAQDPRFETLLARKRNEDDLDRIVEDWTLNMEPAEVAAALQEAGVAAGMVSNGQDLYEDRQLRHRGYYWMLNHAEVGVCAHLGMPFVLSETPARPRMASPCLGVHTECICAGILGMSDAEFVEMVGEGVLEVSG